MKEFLKNILPFNNRTEMPKVLFVVKKILAFWLCYIVGLFLAEGVVIYYHRTKRSLQNINFSRYRKIIGARKRVNVFFWELIVVVLLDELSFWEVIPVKKLRLQKWKTSVLL